MKKYTEQHVQAFKHWQAHGSLAIDETTVRAIEAEDPAMGLSIRQDRERHERAKVEMRARLEQQEAGPVAPQPRWSPPREDEPWGEFVARNKRMPVTFGILDAVVSGRLQAVVRRFKETDDVHAALEQRVEALEKKPSVKYRGVWEAGTVYAEGDAVTRDGSLWISRVNRLQSDPAQDHVSWTLAVKRSRREVTAMMRAPAHLMEWASIFLMRLERDGAVFDIDDDGILCCDLDPIAAERLPGSRDAVFAGVVALREEILQILRSRQTVH